MSMTAAGLAGLLGAVPNFWNPYNVTALPELRIEYLTEMMLFDGRTSPAFTLGVGCAAASGVLPLSDLDSLAVDLVGGLPNVTVDPGALNVGLADLENFAGALFPYPVNNSALADVVTWWTNLTARDARGLSDFLAVTIFRCADSFCKESMMHTVNLDVTGVGIFASSIMVLIPLVVFALSSLAFLCSYPPRSSSLTGRFDGFHRVCAAMIDDILTLITCYSLATLFFALVMRSRANRAEALAADGLAMVFSTATVALTYHSWRFFQFRPRVFAFAGLAATVIGSFIIFATHLSLVAQAPSTKELVCGFAAAVQQQQQQHQALNITLLSSGKTIMAAGRILGTDLAYFPDELTWQTETLFKGGLVFWSLMLVTVVGTNPFIERRMQPKSEMARNTLRILRGFSLLAGILTAAIFIVYFRVTVEILGTLYGADSLGSAEATWTLANVMVIVTFGPSLFFFVHMAISGLDRALECRLPVFWNFYLETVGETVQAAARYVLRRREFANAAPSWVVVPRRDDDASSYGGVYRQSQMTDEGLRRQSQMSDGGLRRQSQRSDGGQRRQSQISDGGQRRQSQISDGGQRRQSQLSNGGLRRQSQLTNGSEAA